MIDAQRPFTEIADDDLYRMAFPSPMDATINSAGAIGELERRAAVRRLQNAGHTVQAADIPGLWFVSGYPELTTGQLLSVAARLA